MANAKKTGAAQIEAASPGRKPGKNSAGEETQQTSADTVKQNIATVVALERERVKNRSAADNVAEKVTKFAGSTNFIMFHVVYFTGWILINTGVFPRIKHFDPFPFNFLTLVVSLEAIFLTLMVLKSQNRMTKEADMRANLDLQINMLDEQETTLILRMVHNISRHLGLEEVMDDSMKDLYRNTDVNIVADTIHNETSQ